MNVLCETTWRQCEAAVQVMQMSKVRALHLRCTLKLGLLFSFVNNTCPTRGSVILMGKEGEPRGGESSHHKFHL